MTQGLLRSITMDTYLRRTYAHKKAAEKDDFPFWDYRSRRGPLSCSNSSYSSTSSCDGSSISSISSRSESGSESISLSEHSDIDSLSPCDQHKMSIQFVTDSTEISSLEEVYQPIVNWIDPDLHILKITDKSECVDNEITSFDRTGARLPSVAMMVFLQEDGMVGFERIQSVKRYFEKSPWKFHHSEQVNKGAINPYPYNSRDFYYTAEELPLCAVRQVHTGKEFFRTVLFVSESNWTQMMQFYKLILGCEPDMKRDDFCLFTVSSYPNFDIQLALKKLQGDTKPRPLECVRLQFRVGDISNIMSLLPNVCRPLSDTRWQTTDNDGNVVILETPRYLTNSTFIDRCSLSERGSISGRSSRTDSFSQQTRNQNETGIQRERVRASLESRRKTSPQTQRSRSVLVDQKLVDKLKQENLAFRQQTMAAIREHHRHLDRTVTGETACSPSATCDPYVTKTDTENVPEVGQSFYV
ncbi:protein FAM124A-like [Mya arenaria]|uniref:protein FAM124A-like n=1 Tax=Mya arenaria TaxID=6604 RepID=UPI0022E0195E|nr:protein FAM124A-like [Mya arenaria]XP_052784714.1 protein FAM124A-like [Mya arenaria]